MRIVCDATPRGTVFRFYRVGENFFTELKPLVPLLLESGGDIEVCDESDPTLMLSVAHLSPEAEAELLRRAKRHLAGLSTTSLGACPELLASEPPIGAEVP